VAARGIFIGEGDYPSGSGGRKPPSGVQGEAPVWGLGDEAGGRQTLKQFADVVYIDVDCRNDQNLRISHNIPHDS